MQARDRTLDGWFARIASGQVRLPRFQRFEAWGPSEVTDLLQTVIEGLPAGASLILQVGDSSPFKDRRLQTAPEGTERLNELLLDGQQRLTALWRSLMETYEDRTYFLDLNNDSDNGAPKIVPQHRSWKNGVQRPLWADDPAQTLERGYVPVRLLRPVNDGEYDLADWLEVATNGDASEQLRLSRLINPYRQRIARFNLPYLELGAATPKHVVLDVFVKMNTRSVRLTPFDIVVAEVEAETGESLHDHVASLNGQVPGLTRYAEASDLVLDAISLMQDRAPNQAGYLGIRWDRALGEWERLVEGAKHTVSFLEQERVPDGNRLPSRAPLAPLIALFAKAPESPDALGNARTLLKRYLWRSFFTDRYEKAAASAALQDYRILTRMMADDTSATPPIFEADLPDADALLATGWPKKKDRLARGVLLLSLQGGALDIADGMELTPSSVGRREYHHLFPVAYLREEFGMGGDEDGDEANTALNCSLITWRTNRTIGAREPVQYLRDRTEAAALGEEEIRRRLSSHAVSFDSLARGDYDGFRLERAQVFEEAIQKLCSGEHWDAPGYR